MAGQVRQPSETSASDRRFWSDMGSSDPVLCACESDMSPVLTVRCPGTRSEPQLWVEKMDENGIEVAWEMADVTDDDDDDVTVCILPSCIQCTLFYICSAMYFYMYCYSFSKNFSCSSFKKSFFVLLLVRKNMLINIMP